MASTTSRAGLALKPQATRFSLLHFPAIASPSSISFDNSRSRPPFFGQALRLVVSHPKISTICGARALERDPTNEVNAATVGGTAKPTTEDNGCLVVNAPTANTVAAAEHGIALLTSIDRNVAQSDASMKAGKCQQNKYVGVSLVGKKLAVMGFGKVGSEVARRAKGLGMQVISYDPYAPADRARAIGVELVSFDEAISTADFISLHMPLTLSTSKIFNDDFFAKMKKGVRIINIARGGVIDEDALLRALENGTVAQAALDVFTEEPPPKDSKLVLHENVTVTPHLGASTTEDQEGVAIEIAEAVIGALRGELAATAVNAPMVPSEVNFTSKKVYIVYLGGYSHGKDATTDDFTRATNSHHQFLSSFLKSNEKAKEAMIYSYNKHINGFSAYLDEKEAMEISKHSDVLSVFESGFKQIHRYHGNPM